MISGLNVPYRRMAIMLTVVIGFFTSLFGYVWWRSSSIQAMRLAVANPPQIVATATAITSEWRPHIRAIGTLRAIKGADLALEQPGVVEKLHFSSGEDVTQGQMLLDLRKEPDLARLEALKAAAELAAQNYRRDTAQLKLRAISQSSLDADLSNLKSAQAQVAQQEALIAQKTLRAPFGGRLGIRLVDVGQYLPAGTPIVTLQDLDPIFVDFMVPQQALSLLGVGQEVTMKVDAYPDETFSGLIAMISPKVDPHSRNVEVRASLKNSQRKLLPGMFARIEINAGKSERLVTLPQTAIVYGPYGNSVFLVMKDSDVERGKQPPSPSGLFARQAFVQIGQTRGDQISLLKGVPPGAEVVTAGQIKLRNGTPVTVDNRVSPTNDRDPKPQDE